MIGVHVRALGLSVSTPGRLAPRQEPSAMSRAPSVGVKLAVVTLVPPCPTVGVTSVGVPSANRYPGVNAARTASSRPTSAVRADAPKLIVNFSNTPVLALNWVKDGLPEAERSGQFA